MTCPCCKKDSKSTDFCQWCFARIEAPPPVKPVEKPAEAAPTEPAKPMAYNPVVPIVAPPKPPPSVTAAFDLSPNTPPAHAVPPAPAMQQTQPVPAYGGIPAAAHASSAPYNPLSPPAHPSLVQTQSIPAPPAYNPLAPQAQAVVAGRSMAQPLAPASVSAQPMANYLGAPAAPQQETTKQVRMSLTGDVYEVNEPAAQLPAPNYLAPPGVASAPPPPVRGATGRYSPTTAGLPATAVTAGFVQQNLADEVSVGERWEKFLAIAMPILALSVLAIHFVPDAMMWIAFADMFIFGLAQGATRSIPSYDEAFLDCSVVLLVCYLGGPILGFGAYLIVGAIKQEWNAAILSVLGVHLVVRLILAIAFESAAESFNLIPAISIIPGASFFGVCCSFAGWILSSFFRPLDEG